MKATIPNQQRILNYLIEGYCPKEIAEKMKSNITGINEIIRIMREEYKCKSTVHLAVKYDRNEIAEFKCLHLRLKMAKYNIAS